MAPRLVSPGGGRHSSQDIQKVVSSRFEKARGASNSSRHYGVRCGPKEEQVWNPDALGGEMQWSVRARIVGRPEERFSGGGAGPKRQHKRGRDWHLLQLVSHWCVPSEASDESPSRADQGSVGSNMCINLSDGRAVPWVVYPLGTTSPIL